MVWYYADGDRQRGPISDEEFQELVKNGRVHNETLIWQDGMESWQPLRDARATGLDIPEPVAPLSQVGPSVPSGIGSASTLPSVPVSPLQHSSSETPSHCSQCRRGPLGPGDGVKLGNLLLCHMCDGDMARHYEQTRAAAGEAGSQSAYLAGSPGLLAYASIFSRAVAKFIDNMIETVILVIVMAATTDLSALSASFSELMAGSEQLMIALRPFLLGSLIFKVLYDSILVGWFGATLGKMSMGIRVVASDGSKATASQAVIRALVPAVLQIPAVLVPSSLIASIAQFVFLFGFLIALMDSQRRTLFDHLAQTRVIK